MKFRSYNKEIKIANSMLRDIFNGMVIDRRDKNNNIQKEIIVPCVNGSRSRILKSLENKNNTLKLPIMSLNMVNIRYDNKRVHTVNEVIQDVYGVNEIDLRLNTAVPLNLTFTLSALTKYQEDMDQILCNFIPFFNPDLYVSYPAPYNVGNINAQIVWDGNVNITDISEISETDPDRKATETSFVMKIWVFPGIDDGQAYPEEKLIYKINFPGAQICSEIFTSPQSGFYEVPLLEPFVEYQEKIENGDIKYPVFDPLYVPAPNDPECIEDVAEYLTEQEKYLLIYPHCDHDQIIFMTYAKLEETVTILAEKNGDEDYVWDWGDGRERSINDNNPSHNYIDGKEEHSIYLYNISPENLTELSSSNSLIFDVNVNQYINLTTLELDNNSIQTIDLSNLHLINKLILNNNNINATTIDNILIHLDSTNIENGELNYENNPGESSLTACIAYDSLIAKGWDIIGTEPVCSGYETFFTTESQGTITPGISTIDTSLVDWDWGDGNITEDTNITSHTYIDGLPSHNVDIRLDDFSQIRDVLVMNNNLTYLNLPLISSATRVWLHSNPNLGGIDLSLINPNINVLNISTTGSSGIHDYSIFNNIGVITASNNNITSIIMSSSPSLWRLHLDNNINISTLDVTPNIGLREIQLQNCSLPSSDLDQILINLDNNGLSNGILNYSNNPGELSLTTLTEYNNLINKGWTLIGQIPN